MTTTTTERAKPATARRGTGGRLLRILVAASVLIVLGIKVNTYCGRNNNYTCLPYKITITVTSTTSADNNDDDDEDKNDSTNGRRSWSIVYDGSGGGGGGEKKNKEERLITEVSSLSSSGDSSTTTASVSSTTADKNENDDDNDSDGGADEGAVVVVEEEEALSSSPQQQRRHGNNKKRKRQKQQQQISSPSNDNDYLRRWSTDTIGKMSKYTYWKDNKMCTEVVSEIMGDARFEPPQKTNRALVNMTFSCQDLFTRGNPGTGNRLLAFYGLRMVALATKRRLEVKIHCPDGKEHADDLITPWVMGHFRSAEDLREDDDARTVLTLPSSWKEACKHHYVFPLWRMFPFMKEEMRRLAIATVGVPSPDHPSAEFAKKYIENGRQGLGGTLDLEVPSTPTNPDVELDDVALHFRCGDIIHFGAVSHGFNKFKGFTDCIPADAKSIGIITQPFGDTTQKRERDKVANAGALCEKIVYAFVDYVRERFPEARVRIRNDANETIALAFARMIMAKVVVTSVSSFSLFPAIANFGVGYIKRPETVDNQTMNAFLKELPPDYPDVKFFDSPYFPLFEAKAFRTKSNRGVDFLIDWFRNDDHCATWEDRNTAVLKPCKDIVDKDAIKF